MKRAVALVAVLTAASLGAKADAGSLHVTLEVLKAGTGTGRITSVPSYIDCGATCAASLPGGDEEGTLIVLRATPDPGSVFSRWMGACTGRSPSCTLELVLSDTVMAVFDRAGRQTSFALAVGKAGNGMVASNPSGISCGSDCSASFQAGATVTLSATPPAGSAFTGWSGACSGSAPSCSLALDEPKAVVAVFGGAAPQALPLAVGRIGSGTVTSNPAGITCGTSCSAAFASGARVTLTARPAPRSTFVGWTGACAGAGATCSVTIDAAKSAMVLFRDATDTVAPTVRALPSSGKPGKVARLRYRVSDDSGQSAEEVTVSRGNRRLAKIRSRLDGADPKVLFYFVSWKVPRTLARGALRFCVQASDAAGNTSRQSCATLRIG